MTFLFLLVSAIQAQGLWHYEMVMDPQHLEELYSYPESEAMYPAHISCPAGESDCLVGFRGTTSVHLPKKSWRIDVFDEGLTGRSRVNLDAHYRDLSMMRNHLAMELVRRMGYPAPLTRHVTLSINGENMGVYLETERIDEGFLTRNGLSDGAFFKAVSGAGRFSPFLSGHPRGDGFEWRTGDEWMLPELLRLIESVCGHGGFENSIDMEPLIGNMVANLAMMEQDGPCKNYYLSLGADGVWRYFPWDHDSSFGNDWQGEFHRELAGWPYTDQMLVSPLFQGIMRDPVHRQAFHEMLDDAASIMATELTACLDSVRSAIRADVMLDPLRQGTIDDFEAACDSLRWFITERAEMLPGFASHHSRPDSLSLFAAPSWITPGTDSIAITAYSSDSLFWCRLFAYSDSGLIFEKEMQPVAWTGRKEWSVMISADEWLGDDLHFFVKMCQIDLSWPEPPLFFPPYSVFSGVYNEEALPSAVRVEAAPNPSLLLPAQPIRLGPSLWALPMVNESGSAMDLSLCYLAVGDPPYRVFFPENLILAPGETLFVASNSEAFSTELPGRTVVGDCSAISATGSWATLFDPGWCFGISHMVPLSERTIRPTNDHPLVTEISYAQPVNANPGDWIECYNPGGDWLDLSNAGIAGSDPGRMVFPEGTLMPPFGFLVLASNTDLFLEQFPDPGCPVLDMGFSLSSDGETLRFINRAGHPTDLVSYSQDPPWPEAESGIIAAIDPSADLSQPASWEAAEQPGTPGTANPSWFQCEGGDVLIRSIRPNPVTAGEVHFFVSGGIGPVSLLVFDLAGRMVLDPVILEPGLQERSLGLPPGLPSGVYYLVVRSAGDTSAGRMIWLR